MGLLANVDNHCLVRRFPFYILIDVTFVSSIQSAKVFLTEMIKILRGDPYALEYCYVSIIFHNNRCILHKESLKSIVDLDIENATDLSFDEYAMHYLRQDKDLFFDLYHLVVRTEVMKTTPEQKGDWKPIIIHISNDMIGFEFGWYDNSIRKSEFTQLNNCVPIANNINIIALYTAYLYNSIPFESEIMKVTDFIDDEDRVNNVRLLL